MNLGHTQRGGTPTAYDRMLATRYGLAAIDLVHKGKFGRLVVLRGTKIEDIPLAEAIAKNRTVDEELLRRHQGTAAGKVIGCRMGLSSGGYPQRMPPLFFRRFKSVLITSVSPCLMASS